MAIQLNAIKYSNNYRLKDNNTLNNKKISFKQQPKMSITDIAGTTAVIGGLFSYIGYLAKDVFKFCINGDVKPVGRDIVWALPIGLVCLFIQELILTNEKHKR